MSKKISVVKELHRLIRDKDRHFDGQVFDIKLDLEENEKIFCDWPNDYMLKFDFSVTPNDGCLKNERYDYKAFIPNDYPVHPPDVVEVSFKEHPFISPETQGHLNCFPLYQDWQPGIGLDGCINGVIYYQFYNPELDEHFKFFSRPQPLAANDSLNDKPGPTSEDP